MRKFCFECGKKTGDLEGGLCAECSGKGVLVKLPKRIDVVACAKCGKMLFRNKWAGFSLEKVVADAAETSVKIKKIGAKLEGKKLKINFVLETAAGNEKTEEHEIIFHANKIICPYCSRKHSGYYEAVLQLRGFGEGDLERMKSIFDNMEKKTFYRIKEARGGFDVKIGNKLVVNSAAKDIRARFPGSEMRKSSKIVTKMDGRDVHRKFVLVRKR